MDITRESAVPGRALAAIDFGISNTDAVSLIDGTVYRWTRPTDGVPNDEVVHSVLTEGGLTLTVLPHLAVTGGRHRALPERISSIPLRAVNEVVAIGRGGQTLGAIDESNTTSPMLVVSAGSGTAVVAARGREYSHVTGTGVGGGTLQGLGRLLLGTNNAGEIDALAQRGNANGADLSIGDVISGKLGTLPQDATAVNFGRLANLAQDASKPDLAAALMTLVGQVIAITAINAARAERLARIVVIGHMTDMPSFRTVVERVGEYYSTEITLPLHAGFGTAIGAMLHEANS